MPTWQLLSFEQLNCHLLFDGKEGLKVWNNPGSPSFGAPRPTLGPDDERPRPAITASKEVHLEPGAAGRDRSSQGHQRHSWNLMDLWSAFRRPQVALRRNDAWFAGCQDRMYKDDLSTPDEMSPWKMDVKCSLRVGKDMGTWQHGWWLQWIWLENYAYSKSAQIAILKSEGSMAKPPIHQHYSIFGFNDISSWDFNMALDRFAKVLPSGFVADLLAESPLGKLWAHRMTLGLRISSRHVSRKMTRRCWPSRSDWSMRKADQSLCLFHVQRVLRCSLKTCCHTFCNSLGWTKWTALGSASLGPRPFCCAICWVPCWIKSFTCALDAGRMPPGASTWVSWQIGPGNQGSLALGSRVVNPVISRKNPFDWLLSWYTGSHVDLQHLQVLDMQHRTTSTSVAPSFFGPKVSFRSKFHQSASQERRWESPHKRAH